jgi:hypothetical protein
MDILKILGAVVFLFGSLALSTMAGSIAARMTRRVPLWCVLALAGCVLLNIPYALAANPIFQWLKAGEGEPLDWQRVGRESLRFGGLGALLGLLGFFVVLRNAPRFFNRQA